MKIGAVAGVPITGFDDDRIETRLRAEQHLLARGLARSPAAGRRGCTRCGWRGGGVFFRCGGGVGGWGAFGGSGGGGPRRPRPGARPSPAYPFGSTIVPV